MPIISVKSTGSRKHLKPGRKTASTVRGLNAGSFCPDPGTEEVQRFLLLRAADLVLLAPLAPHPFAGLPNNRLLAEFPEFPEHVLGDWVSSIVVRIGVFIPEELFDLERRLVLV